MPIERLAPHRHLRLVERILHHVVGVQFVDAAHGRIHVRLLRLREEQELRAGDRLEAGEAEERRFEDFDAREGGARDGGVGGAEEGRGREGAGYRVHAGRGRRGLVGGEELGGRREGGAGGMLGGSSFWGGGAGIGRAYPWKVPARTR